MKKEPKIKFRELEMTLSEAKAYLSDLKSGKVEIELNQREKERYSEIKEIFGFKDEKSYLELLLTIPIITREQFEKENSCAKKGHPGEEILSISSSGKAFCTCNSCGSSYNRVMTYEEHRKLLNSMSIRYNL